MPGGAGASWGQSGPTCKWAPHSQQATARGQSPGLWCNSQTPQSPTSPPASLGAWEGAGGWPGPASRVSVPAAAACPSIKGLPGMSEGPHSLQAAKPKSRHESMRCKRAGPPAPAGPKGQAQAGTSMPQPVQFTGSRLLNQCASSARWLMRDMQIHSRACSRLLHRLAGSPPSATRRRPGGGACTTSLHRNNPVALPGRSSRICTPFVSSRFTAPNWLGGDRGAASEMDESPAQGQARGRRESGRRAGRGLLAPIGACYSSCPGNRAPLTTLRPDTGRGGGIRKGGGGRDVLGRRRLRLRQCALERAQATLAPQLARAPAPTTQPSSSRGAGAPSQPLVAACQGLLAPSRAA